MADASEEFIDGMYNWNMYFTKACWKDDFKVVEKNLCRLKSDAKQYHVPCTEGEHPYWSEGIWVGLM